MSESFALRGPAGRLEALLDRPAEPPLARAALAHPHPLRGGTMNNTVLFRTAKALAAHRVEVLRFNFRGVGASDGKHDDGVGEQDDVRAALDALAARGAEPLVSAGYSFGAVQALRVGFAHPRVAAIVSIGLPVRDQATAIPPGASKPWLVVQGDHDVFGSPDEVRAAIGPAARLDVIANAGHFFEGQASRVAEAVARFVSEQAR